MPAILLIDDDVHLTDLLREELLARGYAVDCLDRAKEGPNYLATGRYDLVLLDNMMPGGMTGIDFLKALRERGIKVPVIVMTGASTPDTVFEAMNLGAFDYVVKSATVQELAAELDPIIRQALEITRPVKEVQVAPGKPAPADTGPVLVGGKNRRMHDIYKELWQFANSAVPVLILGETGTGKELVARALHTNSPRKARPFVALNCAAIPETLLESELFGHEANAFTGAKLRKGKIEYADGGTLFLDEIGDMPLNLQSKLLRVIEYQSVERLGSNEPIKVDVRLVSATHRDLEGFIQEGKFRADLFYRLNRVTLRLPPLRERLDDLPELVEYFLARAAEAMNRPRPAATPVVLDRLRAYQWPGNVRELQNVIFYAVGVCRGPHILPEHLRFTTEGAKPTSEASNEDAARAALRKVIGWAWDAHPGEVWAHLQQMLEKELMRDALHKCGSNQKEAAKQSGIGRTRFSQRMKDYGLE